MQDRNARPALSVMIVEDDTEASEIIIRMIAMQFPEATVYAAEDGIAGEELFKKYTPEIVITDISMPTRNGIEMAKEIKSIKADTKLIVLTAYNDNIFLELFKQIGFQAYLYKPLNLDKLMEALESCIADIRQKR